MEHDESRSVYLEEMAGGEASITVGKKMGTSRMAFDGLWFSGEASTAVTINCPQTETGIFTAQAIAEEIVDMKMADLLQGVGDVIESHCSEAQDAHGIRELAP